jgi:hypothetical protein
MISAQPITTARLEFCGVLTRNAEVRHKPAADGLHAVPVVCLELKSTRAGPPQVFHAEQPFTDATRKEAEALASRLKRGQVVSITTPIDHMQVTFPHVDSIAITTSDQDAPAPNPATQADPSPQQEQLAL